MIGDGPQSRRCSMVFEKKSRMPRRSSGNEGRCLRELGGDPERSLPKTVDPSPSASSEILSERCRYPLRRL